MSQGAAAHYGRPPVSSNPYNYPPAENNYQEPSRYYNTAPNPQGSASPQNVQGGFPPPQQQQQRRPNPNQYYPQEDHNQANPNPVPFYVVAGGGPPPSSPLPDASSPQELATNIYDTPADTIHEAAFIEPPPQQQQQPYYQPYQHRPPYPPTIDGAPSPISPQAPYPVLQQQEAGAAPSYQGYTRPPPGPGGAGYYTAGQQQPQQPQPQQQGPQDYYRTGTGGNELFLPNGSRAQGA